ncbi:MAG: chemotaxis-specific protein-glutamate methyltransferase CheB [Verrucomicrobiota bacterium]
MLQTGNRVLVIDDSPIYRRIFEQATKTLPEVGNVVLATGGQDALKLITKDDFELVVCDMVMPVMDGITVTREILKIKPKQAIVVVSGVSTREASTTMEALSAGAMDFIAKPKNGSMQENLSSIADSIKGYLLANPRSATRPSSGTQSSGTGNLSRSAKSTESSRKSAPITADRTSIRSQAKMGQFNADLVLIGVSTGGPNSLQKLLPLLPKDFGAPIIIVQHMPEGFTQALARQLDNACSLIVKEAEEGEIAEKGNIYISKGGKHLVISEKKDFGKFSLKYTDGPPVNSCRPAVDVLYSSVAKLRDIKVVSTILTGMGSDGANGVKEILASRSIRAYSITQDAESCVVYGMPRAVDEAGLSDESLPLNNIHQRLGQLVRNSHYGARTVA